MTSLQSRLYSIIVIVIIVIQVSCASEPHTPTREDYLTHSLHTSQNSGAVTGMKPVQAYSELESYSSSDCLRCHIQYNENHHPVDFIISDSANFPFPLYEGQVKCLTCHIENHDGTLRGGPYVDRREICFKCHYKEQYADIDPHFMRYENGRIREVNDKPICLICHAKTPNPNVDRTKDVLFRADIAFLCWRCHAPMVNPIFNQHFLTKPSVKMLRNIEKNEQDMNVIIPLVRRGRLTCSTCHNPHQEGVILNEASAKGTDSPNRLRLQTPSLCFACHRM